MPVGTKENPVQVTIDEHSGQTAVMHLSGNLDHLTATSVRKEIANAVATGHARLVIDMDQVAFIDSSGLGSLISGLKAARIAGGDLRIAQPSKQVGTILSLTMLDRVLRPYATVAEALNGY